MIQDSDLEIKTTRGSGPGGQHRNTTDTAVVIKHLPSGLMVRSENEKSQKQNREIALSIIRARLAAQARDEALTHRNSKRRNQVGTGMRADKVRTVRVRDNTVIDHQTGKKGSLKKYMRGDFSEIA